MATKAPDHTMTEPNFASAEYAEQWCRGKRLRGETSVAATEMMLDLAKIQLGDHVLELAAGTGDLAVMTARRVGPSGHVLATDISANMLNLAAEAAREAGLPMWRHASWSGESRCCARFFRCGAVSVRCHAFFQPSQGAGRCLQRAKACQ
jgi:cyclopropane fatty-acyl-phospholipid synthase-like methyltransferase